MNSKKRALVLLSILFGVYCFAQRETNLVDTSTGTISKPDPGEQQKIVKPILEDTTETNFLRDSLHIVRPKLIRPEARIDSRASTFQRTEVNIYGYYVGVMIKEKLSLGIGYYRINTVFPAKNVVDGININRSLIVNCGSINSELIYFNRRFISLGFPLEFAFGQYNLTSKLADDNTLISRQVKFLTFANFGLSGTFKPFKFIGLKLMAGYRKSIYPEEKTFEFNGPYTSLGLFFDMADLISNIRMYKLLKRYHKIDNPLSVCVDLFTD